MINTDKKFRHQIEAPVESVSLLTDDIIQITLHAPEISQTANPGQFVMVRMGNEIDPLLRRPFSIHFADNQNNIQLLIKIVGPVTRKIALLRSEETINILGPLGRGFPMPKEGPVYLVGGGIGAAPLLYLAKWIQEKGPGEEIRVLLGARNKQEADSLASKFTVFGLHPEISTDDGSTGHHGVVGDLLIDLPTDQQPAVVYTCGPHPMLAGIAAICRDNNWPCFVSMETMMACGVAACLGCAIPSAAPNTPYLHVCKNGPVFNAEELQW